MDKQMTFEELMKELASAAGFEAPAPDAETGACTVDFDGTWLTFRKDPEADAVVMTGTVGGLSGEDYDPFMRIPLAANFLGQGTGGAVLGIDADEGTCCLRRRDPYAELDGKAYAAVVECFLDVLEMWQGRWDDLPTLAAELEEFKSGEAAEVHRFEFGDDVIRV